MSLLSSLPTEQLLDEVSKLSQLQEMRVAINCSVKSGLIVGGSTTLSALIAGPVGILIGGLLGTGIATYLGKGQFKSVPEILYNDLSNEQREDLAAAIRHVVTPQNVMTIAHLVLSFQSNEQLVLMVLNVVRNFLSSEMSMKVL